MNCVLPIEIYIDRNELIKANKSNYEDIWGLAVITVGEENKEQDGVEYNFYKYEGGSESAIYYWGKSSDGYGYGETDTSKYIHYDIDFDDEEWETKLKYAMLDAYYKFTTENRKDKVKGMEIEKKIETEVLDIIADAVQNLRDAWDNCNTAFELVKEADVNDFISCEYPFEKAFEDYMWDMNHWCADVKERIEDYKKGPVIKIETNYSAEADRTFILKQTYQYGDLAQTEIIGFYSGEPNEEDTKKFSGECAGVIAYYN